MRARPDGWFDTCTPDVRPRGCALSVEESLAKDADGALLRRARDVCARCASRLECLGFALEHAEFDGVWGGLTGPERARFAVPLAAPRHSTIDASDRRFLARPRA